MKARFWLLGLIFLLLINAAWIWRLDQNNKENNLRMNDTRDRFIEANRELYLLNRDWRFSMKSNDKPLPFHLQVQSTDGKTSIIDKFLGSTKKLVLVLSDRHCSTCVDQLLLMVKTEIPEFYRNNILVLFSTEEQASRVQWQHRKRILQGAEFLEIDDRSLNLPMDSLGNPYFFITGPDQIAGFAFTPYPSLEAQTKEYLGLIKERYFN
jgi:hypothetical protein